MYGQRLFLSFDGRIDRLRFWLGMIAVELVADGVGWPFGVPLVGDPGEFRTRLVAFVVGVVALYPIAAIAVKRLHDRNQSARPVLLLLVACLVALVADLTGALSDTAHLTLWGWIVSAVITVIGLGFLIELGFRRGTPGPNRFGPDPRAERA